MIVASSAQRGRPLARRRYSPATDLVSGSRRYVPEEPRLYSYLTAAEYLELVGGLRDLARNTLVPA